MPVALLSVFDKTGIVYFARELRQLGWEILASPGTKRELDRYGVQATDLATLIGGPRLGHRVVTLSREVATAVMATDSQGDEELQEMGMPKIDLVCVGFTPYEQEEDIGGPALVSAAAKGGRIVVCRESERKLTIAWLWRGRPDDASFLRHLTEVARREVAGYKDGVATHFENRAPTK